MKSTEGEQCSTSANVSLHGIIYCEGAHHRRANKLSCESLLVYPPKVFMYIYLEWSCRELSLKSRVLF
eukprot:c9317_g1_i1 orf=82-285(+)